MNQDNFAGVLLRPDLNFSQVRDGRRSPLFYYDVDLSTARSIAARTALSLNVAGNSFFVDKNPSLVGAATVHFQDTNFGTASAPVYCEPGAVLKVPFTQLLVENAAQAGKILRFHYGVDIDFLPGASSSVFINGNVSIIDTVATNNEHVFSDVAFAAGTAVQTIVAAGVYTGGALIKGVFGRILALGGASLNSTLYAAAAPPVSNASGASRIVLGSLNLLGPSFVAFNEGTYSRSIPANWGLYSVDMASGAIDSRQWSIELSIL